MTVFGASNPCAMIVSINIVCAGPTPVIYQLLGTPNTTVEMEPLETGVGILLYRKGAVVVVVTQWSHDLAEPSA